MRRMSGRIVVSGGIGAILLAGCGAGAVAETELEAQAASVLEQAVGERPEIDCPGDLTAEVGTTMRCTLTAADGTTLGTTITVTSVEGDQVNFDVEVDEE